MSNVIFERGFYCNVASKDKKSTIVSYDMGIWSSNFIQRPFSVYFQNLFCSFMDMEISYPFGAMDLLDLVEAPLIQRYIFALKLNPWYIKWVL